MEILLKMLQQIIIYINCLIYFIAIQRHTGHSSIGHEHGQRPVHRHGHTKGNETIELLLTYPTLTALPPIMLTESMQPIVVAPVNVSTVASNVTTTTPKPKYRISRQELGYILGKNYRGLRKLLRLELNDAANVSHGIGSKLNGNSLFVLFGMLVHSKRG